LADVPIAVIDVDAGFSVVEAGIAVLPVEPQASARKLIETQKPTAMVRRKCDGGYMSGTITTQPVRTL